jgi:hypothetical protein
VDTNASLAPMRNAPSCGLPTEPHPRSARPSASIQVSCFRGQPRPSATGRGIARTSGVVATHGSSGGTMSGRWSAARCACMSPTHPVELGDHTSGLGPSTAVFQPSSAIAAGADSLAATLTWTQRPLAVGPVRTYAAASCCIRSALSGEETTVRPTQSRLRWASNGRPSLSNRNRAARTTTSSTIAATPAITYGRWLLCPAA